MADRNSKLPYVLPQDLFDGAKLGRLLLTQKDAEAAEDSWICRCDCGTTKSITSYRLMRGEKSCGCLGSHGMSRTPIYNCWWGITYRGQNKSKEPCYANGGMHVCKRWRESFKAFYEDMGEKPSPKHSIDRLLNEKGYTCGKCEECLSRGDTANCRWATKQEQSINRSCTHFITLNGETHTLAEWARIRGMSSTSLCRRLKQGWTEADAITKPTRYEGMNHKQELRWITHDGQTHTLTEWAKIKGIPVMTLWSRLSNGWSEQDALTKPVCKKTKRKVSEKTISPEHNPPIAADSTAPT